MFHVNPKDQERFFLRLLLLHVRGTESFEDIRSYEGVVYDTFYEACIVRDLLITDNEWDKCLEENCNFQFPQALCELFAFIISFDHNFDALKLYNKYKEHFFDPKLPEILGEQKALKIIDSVLSKHNLTLHQFNLPNIDNIDNENHNDMFYNDIIANEDNDIEILLKSLTLEQITIFDTIVEAVYVNKKENLYFIDGPGGSGKSYLLNAIIKFVKLNKVPELAVTWTGIAANLLIDIWSLGVILYMLVCGQAPFQEANDSETLTMIMDCKYSLPKRVSDNCKSLITKMIVRDPEKRANIDEISADKWLLTEDTRDASKIIPLVSCKQVSEELHNLIISKMINGNIATKEEITEKVVDTMVCTLQSVTQSPQMCKLKFWYVGHPEFVKMFYDETDKTKSYVDRAYMLQDFVSTW